LSIEKLKLGCKDLEERVLIYKILARIYREREHITQRKLLNIATEVVGYQFYEETLRKYIKLLK